MNSSGREKENNANGPPTIDMSFVTTPVQPSTTVRVDTSLKADCNKLDEQDVSSSVLSMFFSDLSSMIKHVEQYATYEGFMIVHKPKDYFSSDQYKEYFPDEMYRDDAKPPKRGYFGCSSKSHGREKKCECHFRIQYNWESYTRSFHFSSETEIGKSKNGSPRPCSNLAHTHPLAPQLQVYDGRSIVKLEKFLTAEELQTIQDQSLSRVSVSQMRVNLD